MISNWESLQLEETIIGLLRQFSHGKPHHFGSPFVSAYQLAIALANQCPDLVAEIGLPIGGAGAHEHNNLAQYLAHELSTRIKRGEIKAIEGRWMSRAFLPELNFVDDDIVRKASPNPHGLSVFRLTE